MPDERSPRRPAALARRYEADITALQPFNHHGHQQVELHGHQQVELVPPPPEEWELNDEQQRVFDHIVTAVQSNEECMLINKLYADRLMLCNTAILPVGNAQDATKANLYYNAKYLSKNPVELTECLPLLLAARRLALSGVDVTDNVDSDDSDDEVPVLDTDSTDYNYVEVQSRGSLHMHKIIK